MSPSTNCRNLIKRFESFRPKAYLCPAGIPTIGWGHTAGVTPDDVQQGRTITEEQAEQLLDEDLARFSAAVSKAVSVDLSQCQFDAVVSFAFNCKGWLQSTLIHKLNMRDCLGASAEFPRWVHGNVNGKSTVLPGLVTRRAAEQALFEAA